MMTMLLDPTDPIGSLHEALVGSDPRVTRAMEEGEEVRRRYGPLFEPERIGDLGTDDYRAFLTDSRIRTRWGTTVPVAPDLDELRTGLAMLVDERHRVADRLDWLDGKGSGKTITSIPKAVATPVLHVAHPNRYGVWSPSVEAALRRLGLWPLIRPGARFGEQYTAVNRVMTRIADQLQVSAGALESVCWVHERRSAPPRSPAAVKRSPASKPGRRSPTRRGLDIGDTFTCSICFQTKAAVLRSEETADVCIDCA